MPSIQFIGYSRRTFEQEKKHVKRLLKGAAYADKLTIVWLDSVSEGLVDGKSAPFIRIQGRPEALEAFKSNLTRRLSARYSIEIAHNSQWIAKQEPQPSAAAGA